MPTELLTSKLFIAPLRPSLVPRPRLIQLLNEGLSTEHKLILISAPAGFEKTTLVLDWLKQIEFRRHGYPWMKPITTCRAFWLTWQPHSCRYIGIMRIS